MATCDLVHRLGYLFDAAVCGASVDDTQVVIVFQAMIDVLTWPLAVSMLLLVVFALYPDEQEGQEDV